MSFLLKLQELLDATKRLDWLAPLALRLYLAPVFWVAGKHKIDSWESTVTWFGNPDWGLGLPIPAIMAFLATAAEVGGAIALLIGLGVRWMCIPMMITMAVAALTVHWSNGWLAIATNSGFFATERTVGGVERLNEAKTILKQHGDYGWLTENGDLVVLNNGIEFAATYFIMLLALFFVGGGRHVSLDYWIGKKFGIARKNPGAL